MDSILIKKPFDVEIIHKEIPVAAKGEALLRILYGGICGSDLGSYRGTFAYFTYPQIPGHEFSAEVVEVNNDGKCSIKKGMTVVCNPYFNCGSCYSCQHGHVNACMDNKTMGVQREGAFSQYITMPLERIYDGKGISPETLALVEPFCIGKHGIDRAGVQRGEKVLIIGAGTIGLSCAIYAKSLGAEVYITDISAQKLIDIAQFGFDKTFVNSSSEKFKTKCNEITQGTGFDVTVEAVGLSSTFQNCIDAACFGGRAVLIGVGRTNLDFNFTIIQKKELNVFGSRNALKSDFLDTIDRIAAGKLCLDSLISARYPYTKAPEAFKAFSDNAGQWFKVILDFSQEE